MGLIFGWFETKAEVSQGQLTEGRSADKGIDYQPTKPMMETPTPPEADDASALVRPAAAGSAAEVTADLAEWATARWLDAQRRQRDAEDEGDPMVAAYHQGRAEAYSAARLCMTEADVLAACLADVRHRR